MNPSVELRLRTMLRAMNEVILPAIDGDDSLAQEQARLMTGHLQALLAHHAGEGRLAARQRQRLDALAAELLEIADGGPVTRAAGAALAAARGSDDPALSLAVERLVIAAGADGSESLRERSRTLVLAHAREQALTGRAWFRPMGFDAAPDALPDIPDLLEETSP